jgi:hypothetical protein
MPTGARRGVALALLVALAACDAQPTAVVTPAARVVAPTVAPAAVSDAAAVAPATTAPKAQTHESPADAQWDASGEIAITLNGATIDAADDGIRGKDYVVIHDGALRINASGDGIKSDGAEDPARGYVTIDAWQFDITAGDDGIATQTEAQINGGVFSLKTGGGHERGKSEKSAKGVKAGVNLTIGAGQFSIDAGVDPDLLCDRAARGHARACAR